MSRGSYEMPQPNATASEAEPPHQAFTTRAPLTPGPVSESVATLPSRNR